MLSKLACNPEKTRGRFFTEYSTDHRNNFQRDRDRVIHSNSFRRLEYKTQVFVNYEGDHYRTRLTHSLEVSSNARSIARSLSVSEDLAETIALAHDLGHPPFGHAGEDALNECMREYAGFCHNAHAIKLLTSLETRYAAFDGLNLSWESLEGIAKHNGPIANPPKSLLEYNAKYDLELSKFSSIEAQVAAIADDISYHSHDIEDGIRASMFEVKDLERIELLGRIIYNIRSLYQNIETDRLVYEVVRELSHMMIRDIVATTNSKIIELGINSEEDVRNAGQTLVTLSPEMQRSNTEIRNFLYENMYFHQKMKDQREEAKNIVRYLFDFYMKDITKLPSSWQVNIKCDSSKAETVADYIAGMTDRYAIKMANFQP